MSVIDLKTMKQQVLDDFRHDIENLSDETAYQDLSETKGYHLGRLGILRDLGAIGEREHDKLELELIEAVYRERDRRDD